mmetsp:Transcript_23314/g.32800  ORF Transcript_23314/g.32800 Transcript_23314/m.32800 type:complete len:142 (+) Transcript_23314:59-484(+)
MTMTMTSSLFVVLTSNIYFLTCQCYVYAQSNPEKMTSNVSLSDIFLIGTIIFSLVVIAGLVHYIRNSSSLLRSRLTIFQFDDVSVESEDIEKRKSEIVSKLIRKKILGNEDLESNCSKNTVLSQKNTKLKKRRPVLNTTSL